jgi:hypothetical protein
LQSWLLDGAAALRRSAAEEAAARALAVVQRSRFSSGFKLRC